MIKWNVTHYEPRQVWKQGRRMWAVYFYKFCLRCLTWPVTHDRRGYPHEASLSSLIEYGWRRVK